MDGAYKQDSLTHYIINLNSTLEVELYLNLWYIELMPGRKIPIITQQVYHIFNRSIAKQPIFTSKYHYDRFLNALEYYQHTNSPIAFSRFIKLNQLDKSEIVKASKNKNTEMIAYCLMPNHFHLLLKQITDNGIPKLMSNLVNSYTRYFNLKNKRLGPIFEGKYKAVFVEDNDQLLHVSRYIHLNPYSSCLIKHIKDVFNYPYSSIKDYINPKKDNNLMKNLILNNFGTSFSYKKFLYNQADYQKKLTNIKHLLFE